MKKNLLMVLSGLMLLGVIAGTTPVEYRTYSDNEILDWYISQEFEKDLRTEIYESDDSDEYINYFSYNENGDLYSCGSIHREYYNNAINREMLN